MKNSVNKPIAGRERVRFLEEFSNWFEMWWPETGSVSRLANGICNLQILKGAESAKSARMPKRSCKSLVKICFPIMRNGESLLGGQSSLESCRSQTGTLRVRASTWHRFRPWLE